MAPQSERAMALPLNSLATLSAWLSELTFGAAVGAVVGAAVEFVGDVDCMAVGAAVGAAVGTVVGAADVFVGDVGFVGRVNGASI